MNSSYHLANHWKYYPETACFTVNRLSRLGDGESVLLSRDPVVASPVIPNKDGRATDSCFALVGAHQCGVLLEVMGWLAAYVSTTSTRVVVSNKGRLGGYSLQTGTID